MTVRADELPAAVESLERRMGDVEDREERRGEWLRGTVPLIVIGLLAVAANVLIALVTIGVTLYINLSH